MNRRQMIAAGLGAALAPANGEELASRVCLFTDHLAGFTYQEVATMLRQLGVTGPDLTVRKGGLVNPEQASEELPKAAAVMKEQGLSIPMMTTNVVSADHALTKPLLSTAARLGIRYYKLGYYPYQDLSKWQETITNTHRELGKLAALNRELGLHAGLHNHAGDSVGCALWDAWEALGDIDSKQVGFYFDPAQATIEGGKTGWNLGYRRVASRTAMIAVKDFVWEKSSNGWKTRWVPLGQGMVQLPAFCKLLQAARFEGPISLHIEYDPGGATKASRYDRSIDAAARDLKYLKDLLRAT